MSNSYIIFSDGACLGNPGPGGYGAIVADGNSVTEIGGFEAGTTNNRMEMTGALKALHAAAALSKIQLYTDSQYLINGITKWIFGWMKKGWQTAEGQPVINADLWQELKQVIAAKKLEVDWHYVRGHTGTPANERVDEIATGFAAGKTVKLYKGPFKDYPVSLDAVPEPLKKFDPSKNTKTVKALGYLSLVNGELQRHATWPECEARVKGASGAKFKKFTSEGESEDILKSWGVKK